MSTFCFGSGSSSFRPQVELHEDEVVELHVAVARAARPAVGLAAAVLGAAVVEDLGARAAGPGSADRQKLSLPQRARSARPGCRRASTRPRSRPSSSSSPSAGSPSRTRDPEPLRVEPHLLVHELPGEVDGAVLEVVAEREVAEHLEEGAVRSVRPDVLEVGVLAACAQHLLGADRALRRRLSRAEEVRLERLHPGDDAERRAGRRRAGSASGTAPAGARAPRRNAGTPRAARRSSACATV